MDSIGPYKILDTLPGGRRPLYIASAQDGSIMAIKTAPTQGLASEERQRFERETSICATLDHPNLVRVVDSGETAEFLYQVMPFLQGSDLSKVFASARSFSWDEKLALMDGICQGLAYAHGRGLVHRDIKPANLFLENSGHVRILDFGMVRMDSSALTRAGSAVGTLNYMAPEQVRGEICTTAADVFAAGIVFHELCTGSHPFGGGKKNMPEILSAILFEAAPAWTASGAPEGLEFVIRRALEKQPAQRWQDANALRHALSLCRFTLENQPAPPAVPDATPDPKPDFDKTVVFARPHTPPPAAAPPRPSQPPPAVTRPEARFCTSCAHPNAKDAVVCARCGMPLVAGTAGTEAAPSRRTPIVAGLVVLLIIAVVVIAIFLNRL